jgi:hypothetical protein
MNTATLERPLGFESDEESLPACVFRSWKAAIPTDAGPGFRMMPGRV